MALSKKPLKIFHTSDIHLGAYDKKSGRFSEENKIKQEKNFIRLVDIGIEKDFFSARKQITKYIELK